ncbi:MAG TPA: ABC transporter substrate-binding protein [Usitatibacter sp.]|nr:ABC transporter substrate-binding protein [Usitatibacter sp.]
MTFRSIAAATLLGAALAAHAQVPGVSNDRVLIGQTAGFTGTQAGAVNENTAGARMYIDWVNKNGGVHGRKIELVSLDDVFDPKKAGANTKILIDEKKVFAMFLTRGTPHNEVIIPLIKAAGVPLVAPSTGAQLLHEPVNPLIFNVRAKYQLEAEKGIVQLTAMGIQRIGVIHVDDSFGKDALAGAVRGFSEANVKPMGIWSYDRTTPKFEAAVEGLLATNPQAAVLLGSGNHVAEIVKQIRAKKSSAQLMTLSNNASSSFVKSLGANAHGVIVTQVFPNPKMATTPIAVQMQKLAKETPNSIVSHQAMEGFAAAKVLVEGLKRAGRKLTRESFIAGLNDLKGYDLGGMKLDYSPSDHTGTEFVELSIVGRRGDFVQN